MSTIHHHDLLLIIDMQNVYLPGQEWACPSMPRSLSNVHRLLDSGCIGNVMFTQFLAAQEPVGCWKTYNSEYRSINEDDFLCAITDDLQPYLAQYPTAVKSTYSSLKNEEVLGAVKQADAVLLTGVVAECCVLATLMEAIDLGCKVIYLTDCVSGQNDENEKAIETIARSFDPMHVRVMTTEEYLAQ